MPPRALNPEDKHQKRECILDAAQALWNTHTDRISSMDALAQASGVAKGTLYLYFRSKEEVLLGVHERDLERFFRSLAARARQPESMRLQDMANIVTDAIRASPTFLPLSSLCMGLMERQIPPEVALAFKHHIHAGLGEAVEALQTHFPRLTCLHMMQGYALLLGLWQVFQSSADPQQRTGAPCDGVLNETNFLDVISDSLLTLFNGLLNPPDANA